MTPPLRKYRTLPVWTADSLPKGFREQHNTKEGTWAKLTILQGQLKYYALNEAGDVLATNVYSPSTPTPYVEPQAWHRVEPLSDDLQCYLEFHCKPERYYEKKYKLSAPHSEVIAALDHIAGGKALDLGCGRGRNSVYLRTHGLEVTAVDHSTTALDKLRQIVDQEDECEGIDVHHYDIVDAALDGAYDLIVCTVVMQFLPAQRIGAVLANMQACTRPGGIHLIVAPMSTPQHPCPIEWPCAFGEGELRGYYEGWSMLQYHERLGTFHRLDEHGNRYESLFATLVARRAAG